MWCVRRSSSAPVRRSEPKTPVHSSKGRLGGNQDGAPLVALAEDLEQQFRAGAGEWGRSPVRRRSADSSATMPLQVQQASLIPGLHQFVDQGGGGW